jgi:Family of unknown function (DUF6328)
VTIHAEAVPDYDRDESRAHQLDRNWAELIQELRVIGTGVQILFAFLLTIAFQARFSQTSSSQRDLYLVTLLLSGLAAALLIAPVAMHRFLFGIRVKDKLVSVTNRLSILGLAVLSLSMVGAIVLTTDWVGGNLAAVLCGAGASAVFGAAWFAVPLWVRHAYSSRPEARPVQSEYSRDGLAES